MSIEGFKNITNKVSRRLTAFFLLGLILTVTIQVIARQIMKLSTPWTEELSKYFLIWSTFSGAVGTFISNEHLLVDILSVNYGRCQRNLLWTISNVIALVFASFMVVFGIQLCTHRMILNTVTNALEISRVWMYFMMPASMAMIAIVALLNIYQSIAELTLEPPRRKG